MRFVDTHTHLYLENFNNDRHEMLQRAIEKGVDTLLLPNIDKESFGPMMELCSQYPHSCYPMIGLHPGSVGEDVEAQLNFLEKELAVSNFIAIGEIGIDLYWDTTYKTQQINAFNQQLEWAKALKLPVAIHTREAFPLVLNLVEEAQDGNLKGVFHCFTGTSDDAKQIIDLGFYMGIGGVLTYKKSTLPEAIKDVPLSFLLLETDAPFLPPVPYRGKRNESAYIIEIATFLAEIKQVDLQVIADTTTKNAQSLFNI